LVAIRPLAEVVKAWIEYTPPRVGRYEAGVRMPKKIWEEQAIAAADAWSAGVMDAAARGAFAAGVREAGQRTWSERTLLLGPERWPRGVRVSEARYRTGFEKYHAVIEATTLPPRRPRGAPENIERVRIMAAALHEARVR